MKKSIEVLNQFKTIFKSEKLPTQPLPRESGLSGTQVLALSHVAQNPGVKVTEVATHMAIHQTTATNLIEKLVKKGVLIKQRSTEDQRVVRLFPTEAGSELVKKVPKPTKGLLPHALDAMPENELEQLSFYLAQLTAKMEALKTPKKNTSMPIIAGILLIVMEFLESTGASLGLML